MASTIRTMNLVCGLFTVPVALRGASEKKDVAMGRAIKEVVTPAVEGGADAVYGYRKVRQLLVAEPDESQDKLVLDPLLRDKKNKVEGTQFDADKVVPGIWDDDQFIEIASSDVEQIEEMTTVSELVIQDFISVESVPWERAMASYFLAPPSNSGTTALRYMAMLHEAMEKKGVAGVAKLMPKSRQKLCVIYPKHGGLMVTVIAYADTFQQVLDGAASIEGVKTNPAVVELIEQLIDAKAADADALNEYRDDLIDLRADLIERAKLGTPLVDDDAEEETSEAPQMVGEDMLIEKLRESVEALKPKPKPKAKKKSQPRKKAASKSGGESSRRRPAQV